MIRLTDEEIQAVIQSALASEDKELGDYIWMVTDEDRQVVKAQLRKLMEWLRDNNVSQDINDCLVIEGDAFQALLEETK